MYRVISEDTPADPFASLIEAQQVHIDLVERTRAAEARAAETPSDGGPDPTGELAALREEIGAFELRLVATGARLPEGSQRGLAQSLLDFWALRRCDLTTLMARLTSAKGSRGEMPEAAVSKALLPYDPATAEAAAAAAEQAFQALPDDPARDAARSGFLALLQGELLVPDTAAALEPFVAAGVLVRQPADDKGTAFALAHEALPQAWPRLAEWQLEAARIQSELDRLRSSAKAWEATKSVAELPRGEAVNAVVELSKQDDSLKEYVNAAEAQRKRDRAIAFIVVGAVVALAIYGVAATFWRSSAEVVGTQTVVTQEIESDEVIDFASDEEGADTPSGSTGWLWLGSTGVPQVAFEGGTAADPAKLASGMRVRTRANLKIRRSKPDDDGRNVAGARIGQVSDDVIVELRSEPRAVTVRDVQQYWAEVRVIPVVYIQLDATSDAPLAELKQALARAGFQVPREQQLPQIARIDAELPFDVRYYYEQDERTARRVARLVLRWLGNTETREDDTLLPLVDTPLAERVKTGTIEVWLYQP